MTLDDLYIFRVEENGKIYETFVLQPVTDTALPAMTVLRSFAEQDNVKLLTATEYNCTVHMFRQLVLKPVTDTQAAMTELRNSAKQAADSYTTIPHVVLQFHSYCQLSAALCYSSQANKLCFLTFWQSVLNFAHFSVTLYLTYMFVDMSIKWFIT